MLGRVFSTIRSDQFDAHSIDVIVIIVEEARP